MKTWKARAQQLAPMTPFAIIALCGLAFLWEIRAIPVPAMPSLGDQRELLDLARTEALDANAAPGLPEVSTDPDIRGVLVTLYFPGTQASPITSWKDVEAGNVAFAVARAAEDAGRGWRQQRGPPPNRVVVRIDLTGVEARIHTVRPWVLDAALDPGVDGLLIRRDGKTFVISPSARVEYGLSGVRAIDAVKRMAGGSLSGLRRFRSASFLAHPGGEPLTVVRGNVLPPYPASAADLRLASSRGADYLARMLDSNGRFVYLYEAREGRSLGDYNLLRHAGTLWAMFQVYGMDGDPVVRAAGERGLAYLHREYVWKDPRHPDAIFLREPRGAKKLAGDIKLGACGLGILAFVEAERAGIPLSEADKTLLIGLGNGILAMQKPDGELRSYHAAPGEEASPRRSVYYPGEAILALTELHVRDGDAKWLDAAKRAADFQVLRRWQKAGIEVFVPPDAWLGQALEKLWLLTKEKRYERYAYKIADELLRTTFPPDANVPLDLRGATFGYDKVVRVTPTSSRNEAVIAIARLARAAGEEKRAQRYLEAARAAAWFGIAQQYRPESSHFLRSPESAMGGIRESILENHVRIDGVQHAVSGFLGLADMLDPPEPKVVGTSGEGS